DSATITEDSLLAAAAKLERVFDFTYGGFGRAPKFPHPMDLQLLLRVWSRSRKDQWLGMVTLNLDKMAHGGIYDHLAGGFARYSVDQRWLVPHFEKMLYDNALLTSAYLEGFLATGNQKYAEVARETIEYILREMTDDEGGFHSTEDADSEGVEGKFYVWTPAEIREVLGQQCGERFCDVYDVTEVGNFEGQNILNLPRAIEQSAKLRNWNLWELKAELTDSRAKLRAVRERRVRPGRDDKVLVSWNGLMIDALARAAGVLGAPQYYDAAARAAKFLLSDLRDDNGRMLHCWRHGKARLSAYLDVFA
ncbi:MAG: thioredoxin domain-containing protein, partial [Pirellulaceae bacterium]|nr:thioredoxin domain-containing protein [Pirellulaceae bacterium]